MDFAQILKLAETTHDRNNSRPKRPTKIDSLQNKAEMTQAEMTQAEMTQAESTRPKRPAELSLTDNLQFWTPTFGAGTPIF